MTQQPNPANAMPISTMITAPVQSGEVAGTAVRWSNGDRAATQPGQAKVPASVHTTKPPTTGVAPAATTARGAQPSASWAAATASRVAGNALTAPATASSRLRGAPAVVAPR